MDIRILASGSAGNCYVIDDGRSRLLLECGIRFGEIQRGCGFAVSNLAGCLVSHSHGDHSRSAAEVMRAGVDLYTSRTTADEIGVTGHRLHIIAPLRQFRLGTWTILPWAAVHDVDCLGFLLVSDAGDRICYATDTAYIPYRFRGLTGIAVECNHSVELLRRNVAAGAFPVEHFARVVRNHMSLERVLQFLAANDLSKVIEIHLIHVSDENGDEEAFKGAVQRATGKMVFVAPAKGVS